MNSHEYAVKLQKTAELLLSKPEIQMTSSGEVHMYHTSKETLLENMKALGSGEKKYSHDYFEFRPTGTLLLLYSDRSLVCRKIQEVKWECDPIFSTEELEAL